MQKARPRNVRVPFPQKGYKPKSAPSVRTIQGVKKLISKVISNKAERKTAAPVQSSSEIYGFDTASPATLQTMIDFSLPLFIDQGTGQGDRLGNEITLKRFPTTMLFSAPAVKDPLNNWIDQDVLCRFVVGRLRNNLSQPEVADIEKLFQYGNTSEGPGNTIMQLYAPLNKDHWIIKRDIKFRLRGTTMTDSGTTNSDMPVGNLSGRYHLVRLDLKKYLPKTIKYDDDVNPTNVGLWGFLLTAEGVPFNSASVQQRVNVEFNSWPEFTDL